MQELKKCPFCGGEADFYFITTMQRHWIGCSKCNCASNAFETEEEAIEAWNTRAYEEKGERIVCGEAPKPPEPTCKDRNGEIIREGDTVYHRSGRSFTVVSIEKHPIHSDWHVIEVKETSYRYSPNDLTKKRPDCVDQIIEEIESGKLTAASCIKARLEAIKERKGADFGY